MRDILQYAVEWNTIRENVHTRLQAFDSWRQVAEIILTGCPQQSVQGEQRRNVIIELLNSLIKKVCDDMCNGYKSQAMIMQSS